MKYKTVGLLLLLAGFTSYSHAAGYTNWAIPSSIEIVNGGVLIAGNFGNPHNCGIANYIFIPSTNENKKEIIALVTTALMGKREMQFYAGRCAAVGFHWSGDVINENRSQEPVYIR